jgi:SAM-dependent methyltransferase
MESREYRALHAEWYELRSAEVDHRKEIDYWVSAIAEAGEPALELGSGTGRVLVALLEQGLDIVGIDTSPDMTARCVAACQAKGLTPELHLQSMLEFDLPRQFGLIFLDSGGMGLFTSDQDIETMFERVMSHLRPGGTFIYEFEPIPKKTWNTSNWTGNSVKGPEGALITLRSQRTYDETSNVWEQVYILEKFVDGKLMQTEANERVGRYFSVDQATDYATTAGFEEVSATNWLTNDPPNKDSSVVTVRCRKPT